METEQKPTQETHPGESQLNASGGDEAVTDTAVDPLAIINEATGRDYKDLETAKQSIKEMQKEASQKQNLEAQLSAAKEAPKTDEELRAVVANLTQQVNQNQTDTFFAQNPDHSSNRALLEKIAKADGITVAEAVNSDTYKPVFEAMQTASEVQSKQTIATPNKRTSQPAGSNELPQAGDKAAAGQYVVDKFFKSN